jgi:hypothetical protein
MLYFIAHRSALKVTITLIGIGISLILLAVACSGAEWPSPLSSWALVPLWLMSLALSPNEESSRDDIPTIIWQAGGMACFILMAVFGWHRWHHDLSLFRAGYIAILFAWETLFFQYGALSAAETQVKV